MPSTQPGEPPHRTAEDRAPRSPAGGSRADPDPTAGAEPTPGAGSTPGAGPRTVAVRYWAAARDAAGLAEEDVEAGTLADLIAVVSTTRGPRLAAVLARSAFLVDDRPAGTRDPATITLATAKVVEILPPFAGG